MLKIFLITTSLIVSSCGVTSSQNGNKSQTSMSENSQTSSEILGASSQGGKGDNSFEVLNNQADFNKAYSNSNQTINVISDTPETPKMKLPQLPNDKKAVLLNLGNFRSGDHTVQEIKNVSVQNGVLYVEVPQKINEGGMEIQVLSKPWVIFTIPTNFKFNSVQLKYIK